MARQFWQYDGFALAEQFGDGTVTPVGILEQFLDRIQNLNPQLNAVVCMNDEAMADAPA